MSKKILYHGTGHHKRIKESIRKNPLFATESHLLEAMLTYLYIRKDTKAIAKEILKNSSLQTIFIKKDFTKYSKSLENYLLFISQIRENLIDSLPKQYSNTPDSINEETTNSMLLSKKTDTLYISTPHDAIMYSKTNIVFSHTALFWIILLDNKKHIIGHYPFNFTDKYKKKELLNTALEKYSSCIILLEKKESDSYLPTKQDMIFLANHKNDFLIFNIILLDYIIFTNTGSLSLEKYNIHPL
ncbi:MAG: JAB domain-containing protein [Desulfovibrionaceae bacterium]